MITMHVKFVGPETDLGWHCCTLQGELCFVVKSAWPGRKVPELDVDVWVQLEVGAHPEWGTPVGFADAGVDRTVYYVSSYRELSPLEVFVLVDLDDWPDAS